MNDRERAARFECGKRLGLGRQKRSDGLDGIRSLFTLHAMQHIWHRGAWMRPVGAGDVRFHPVATQPIAGTTKPRSSLGQQPRIFRWMTGGAAQFANQQRTCFFIGDLVMPSESLKSDHKRARFITFDIAAERSKQGDRQQADQVLSTKHGGHQRGWYRRGFIVTQARGPITTEIP